MVWKRLLVAAVVGPRVAAQTASQLTATDAIEAVALRSLRVSLGAKRIGLDTGGFGSIGQTTARTTKRANALATALGATKVAGGARQACVARVNEHPSCRAMVDILVKPVGVQVVGDTAWVEVNTLEGGPSSPMGGRTAEPLMATARMRLVRVGGKWFPGAWILTSMT